MILNSLASTHSSTTRTGPEARRYPLVRISESGELRRRCEPGLQDLSWLLRARSRRFNLIIVQYSLESVCERNWFSEEEALQIVDAYFLKNIDRSLVAHILSDDG